MSERRVRRRKPRLKFDKQMYKKLGILFWIVVLALFALCTRIAYLNVAKGDNYSIKVLEQQSFTSKTIPYKRGDIKDRNGNVLATSVMVYNLIIDSKVVMSNEKYLTPTVNALVKYFDFNEDKIVSMTNTAKELGIELFVLDDGWFGNRNNDHQGLGDWFPNLDKLPHGINGLSKRIHDLGLKFGLWFEPEMVNEDSNLYRNHPEWVLKTPHRKSCHGRNQYILDFSNPEVVEYIAQAMMNVIDDSYISYIKWDMNRCMSEVYSSIHDVSSQGRVMHEYILGVYHLYEVLTNKYPDILFESCASGGARFDPGMLYYAPQCWTSDDTDAIERLKIQYGTSLVYPLSSMGSHVSAIPNHQAFRNTPLETRANVAYFGTFGYELDVNSLSDEEKEIIKKQIVFMKQYRSLFQFGTFYRLKSPFEGNETAWMVVSKERDLAIVGYYRTLQEVNVGYRRLLLEGLDENKVYHVNDLDLYGDELMNVGLIISDSSCGENKDGIGDYYSKLYILKEKKENE